MKKRDQGFSLLEISLILLIMGIIGIAAIPSLQNIRRQELNKIANELCLDLVTQRAKQLTNSSESYTLSLVGKAAGAPNNPPYYAYRVSKVGGATPIIISDHTNNANSVEITMYGADGTTAIQTLRFEGGKIKDESGGEYGNQELIIEMSNDDARLRVSFNVTTGHYEIIKI